MANIILASSSPRRQELLTQLGLDFKVHSPDVDETVYPDESVEYYVERLAREKAQAVLTLYPDAIVIAADTSLSFAGKIIGKPDSKQHAFEIWTQLSGQWHDVYSGICVASRTKMLSDVVRTQVEFMQLSSSAMEAYWDTGEPIGKAGAYAIQGIAARFIPQIRGSYSNVMGLPLHETAKLLESVKAFG